MCHRSCSYLCITSLQAPSATVTPIISVPSFPGFAPQISFVPSNLFLAFDTFAANLAFFLPHLPALFPFPFPFTFLVSSCCLSVIYLCPCFFPLPPSPQERFFMPSHFLLSPPYNPTLLQPFLDPYPPAISSLRKSESPPRPPCGPGGRETDFIPSNCVTP